MGRDMVPKRIFLTKGVGKHKERLTSFELALRDAGIASQNLVRVKGNYIGVRRCKELCRWDQQCDVSLINWRKYEANDPGREGRDDWACDDHPNTLANDSNVSSQFQFSRSKSASGKKW